MIEALAVHRPRHIIAVADGPREHVPGDQAECRAAREVVEQIAWPCRIDRIYSEVNLGCARRVSSGLDAAFAMVDEAIVLEEDCVPAADFLPYCRALLACYRDDSRVMAISGDNFQNGRWRGTGDYYFSIFPHCWGWATWRRAWQKYDHSMASWGGDEAQRLLARLFGHPAVAGYWASIFDRVKAGEIDSWAYRWTWACWWHGGLCALPNRNLVSNIGHDAAGTHTRDHESPFANMPLEALEFPLKPPKRVRRHRKADRYTQQRNFHPYPRPLWRRAAGRVRRLLARMR